MSIIFEIPEGRIDTGDNMLQITNNVTSAVASGQITIEEATKLNEFLKKQRWQIQNAKDKKKDEEWKKSIGIG